MSAKINNFINLGGAGDGSESLPAYGIFWMYERVLYVYEINDINNPRDESNKLLNGETVEFKRLLYKGEFDGDIEYTRVDGEITGSISLPKLLIKEPIMPVRRIPSNIISYDSYENILEFMGISEGFIFATVTDDGESVTGIVSVTDAGTIIIGTYHDL